MSKSIPPIQQHMTASPHSIGFDQTLGTAHAMMREHHIRHLPVLAGGRLVGIVTERDLHLVETMAGVDPHKVKVDEAMSSNVYAVPPDAPLDEVAREMAERRYGSVVVMDRDRVVGIFTSVDAARTLAELLQTRLRA